MLYAVSWFIVAALLGLWSLSTWLMHAVAVWTVSNAGALTGIGTGAAGLPVPPWLADWIAPEAWAALTPWLASLGGLIDGVLSALPALAGGVTVAAWVLWALGAAVLLVLGIGLHVAILLWRRRDGPAAGHGHAHPLAAR